MGNFKASISSSSGFVCVTTVLILLAVIINIYPATAAASLKAVEEVAKDQGTTEVASVHHHEIRERVLLPGTGALKSVFTGLGRAAKGAVTNAKPVRYRPSYPRNEFGDFMRNQLHQELDKFCTGPTTPPYCYIYSSAVGSSCNCGWTIIAGFTPCKNNGVASHCCGWINGGCTLCCVGEGTYGPRPGVFP